MDETRDQLNFGTRLAWGGLVVVVATAVLRAMLEHDPFPWWQADPFVFSPPVIGLTPRWALLLNVGALLGSATMTLGLVFERRPIGWLRPATLAVALVVIAIHVGSGLRTVVDGGNLAAIAAVLFAAGNAHLLPGAQRIIAAVGLGIVVLLVCMGAYEVFVTHPQTVANYEHSRESFLAARGWSRDSFEAMTYERRLRQPEPLVWFGLTNVFASFCGAAGVGLLVMAWRAGKERAGRAVVAAAGAAGLLGLAGLLLTGAKGGIGATVLGAAIAGIGLIRPKLRFGGWTIALACLLALLAVAARGLIGERIGELSLLFRWQYMVGSVRMWLTEPLIGVGPGRFQELYALLKPPTSPEDVASAHSVAFDWLATLGLGGVALIALFVRSLLNIRPGLGSETKGDEISRRGLLQITALVIAFAMLISLQRNMPVMDARMAMVYLVGCGGWLCVALLVTAGQLSELVLRWALLGAAAVLAIHAMIEVTATWFVSGMLWAMLVGSAGTRTLPSARRWPPAIAVVAMVTMSSLLGWRWFHVNAWERGLHGAARPARQIAELRQLLDELEFTDRPQEILSGVADELSRLTGQTVPADLDRVLPMLNGVEIGQRELAVERLERAIGAFPGHVSTRVAASQQLLWIASVYGSVGEQSRARNCWDRALGLFENAPLNASGHQWAASIHFARAMQFPGDERRESWLGTADEHWRRSLGLAPYNPHTAVKLMDLAVERGRDDDAERWALEALALHASSRLDPLRGLPEDALRRATALAE